MAYDYEPCNIEEIEPPEQAGQSVASGDDYCCLDPFIKLFFYRFYVYRDDAVTYEQKMKDYGRAKNVRVIVLTLIVLFGASALGFYLVDLIFRPPLEQNAPTSDPNDEKFRVEFLATIDWCRFVFQTICGVLVFFLYGVYYIPKPVFLHTGKHGSMWIVEEGREIMPCDQIYDYNGDFKIVRYKRTRRELAESPEPIPAELLYPPIVAAGLHHFRMKKVLEETNTGSEEYHEEETQLLEEDEAVQMMSPKKDETSGAESNPSCSETII